MLRLRITGTAALALFAHVAAAQSTTPTSTRDSVWNGTLGAAIGAIADALHD